MAQYIGEIKGNKGTASRLGSKESGLYISASGWDIGVECEIYFDKKTEKDIIKVYKTGGSNYPRNRECISTITEK